MTTTLFFVFAFAVVAVLVYMARYSGRLRVEEKRLIAAPLADVYAQVIDFSRWQAWAPWLEHDPAAQVRISGTAGVKGAAYAWESARVGAGEIVLRKAVDRVSIEQSMQSIQPFRFKGRCEWTFAEVDGQTEVTWRLRGRVGFSLRAFAQTVQGMIAFDFRYGLDRLARSLEAAGATAHYQIDYLGPRDVAPFSYVHETYNGPISRIGEAMRQGFPALYAALAKQAVAAVGAPVGVYVKTNIKQKTTVCHLGIPVGDGDCGDLPVRRITGHRAYVVRLTGNYRALEIAWYQAMQKLRIENIKPDQRLPPFEQYVNDPATLPETAWQTELYIPIQENQHA